MVPGYHDVRQLGEGRTGRVFLSTYRATGAYVAIKYLNATLRRDEEFMRRYREDAPALVEIDDPNAVRLHEYVETPSRAALVMELVDGVSLRELLTEHGAVGQEGALVVLKSVLAALAAAHDKGVTHRDVTPENVLVQADGASRLSGFGVVVHAEEPGVPAGSPPYMAPELWTRGEAGPPADLYAAACVLFEAVRGRPPYRAEDVPALRDRHLVEPVPLEVVPDPVRALLERGLAKDPAARFASARQFAAVLEQDAAAGYGPEWETRGRRHLAELATVLALRFPLAGSATAPPPGSPGERRPGRAGRPARAWVAAHRPVGGRAGLLDLLLRAPKLPAHLWVAGATVIALAATLLISGGRLPPGPATVLLPPETPGALDPGGATGEPGDEPGGDEPGRPARTPVGRPTGTSRTTTAPATPPPATSPPATAPTTGTPPTAGRRTPPPGTTAPRRGATTASPEVRSAGILAWSGSDGSVRVTADGPGPVRLRITYTRREEDGPARQVARETRTLSGRTEYTAGVRRDLGAVACGRRAYFAIVAMTEPAAANGPQISETAVHGPACPFPTAGRSATPSQSPPATTPQGTPYGT